MKAEQNKLYFRIIVALSVLQTLFLINILVSDGSSLSETMTVGFKAILYTSYQRKLQHLSHSLFNYTKCNAQSILYNATITASGNMSCERLRHLSRHKCYKCSHLMTVTRSRGRTGNNMFQIASLIGVANMHGYTPVIDYNFPLVDIFNLQNLVDFELENVKTYNENVCCAYSNAVQQLDHAKNWTLHGFFQSWRYFDDVEHKLRKLFVFKSQYSEKVKHYLGKISRAGVANVGIHIRRGDIAWRQNDGYVVAPASYIQRAIKYFYREFRKVQFIFVSDDMRWCRENFRVSNMHFSPFIDPGYDMALLASCDHTIITSGSFGWWGAWLSGGITVYYSGFPKMDSDLEKQFNTSDYYSDYYPSKWIGLY